MINLCLSIVKAFINHEFDKLSSYYDSCLDLYLPLAEILDYFFYLFQFPRYLSTIRLRFEECVKLKNQKYVNNVIVKRFGIENKKLDKHLFHFPNFALTHMECSLIARRLVFCNPSIKFIKERGLQNLRCYCLS